AAVWSVAAVGVDDNLTASQTRVALRSAGHKPSGGIDVVFGLVVEQITRHSVSDNVLANLSAKLLVRYFRRVLRRDNDSIDAERAAIAIFDRDLGLAVRSKIGKLAGLPNFRESLRQPMRKLNRQRHQLRRLIAS